MAQDHEKEIITIVMETEQGFNVYTGIGAKEVDTIGMLGLLERDEPDLFTPDLYKAVTFAEYVRSRHEQRIVFILTGEKEAENPDQLQYAQQLVERTAIIKSPALAELCINIGDGQAVISPEGKIEFHDTGLNISLRDMQFVVQEAEAYMKYREERCK